MISLTFDTQRVFWTHCETSPWICQNAIDECDSGNPLTNKRRYTHRQVPVHVQPAIGKDVKFIIRFEWRTQWIPSLTAISDAKSWASHRDEMVNFKWHRTRLMANSVRFIMSARIIHIQKRDKPTRLIRSVVCCCVMILSTQNSSALRLFVRVSSALVVFIDPFLNNWKSVVVLTICPFGQKVLLINERRKAL